jgi:predicted metal-dependent phosphoesterase TrpH
MVEKGYVSSIQQAFDQYLDESGACFVSRDEPEFGEAMGRILSGGGLPVLPHPRRVTTSRDVLEERVREMREMGLRGIEVYHSDHSQAEAEFYASLARRHALAVTGGSDFHGAAKPLVALGTGIGENLDVPRCFLDDLRRMA